MISSKKIILICVILTPLLLDTNGLTNFISSRKENATEDPRLSAPWVASIFKRVSEDAEWKYHCSGTLTAAFVVITAASCVSSKLEDNDILYHTNYTNLRVYTGLRNINQTYSAVEDNYTQWSEVSLIREHKPPKNPNATTHFQIYPVPANLAAILVKTEFNFTNYVQPASISETPIVVGEFQTRGLEHAIFAGFDLNPKIERSENVTQVQNFNLTIIGNNWCRNFYLRHTSYSNVVCGHLSGFDRKAIPCFMEGAGLIVHVDEPGYLGPKVPFLIGVYTSNSATLLNKTDPYPLSIVKKNTQCTQSDVAFFTKHGEYFEWARSHTHCERYQLPCQDGGCVHASNFCSGKAQCDDKSDESEEICKNQKTCREEDQFTCGNGACIPRDFVCDADMDCVDNSDESDEQKCREKAEKRNITCPQIPKKDGVTTLCMLPEHLGGTLIENCTERAVPVGTTAVQYCSKYFKGEVHGSVKCKLGFWSNSTFLKCKPDCGFSEPINEEGNINTNGSKYGEWPWHVAIYESKNGTKEFICGGSLISTKVVLTAAYCVAESGQNTPKDKSTLRIVMGKQSSAYNRDERKFTQESGVKKILIHESYTPNTFEGDIAMIVLDTPVNITSSVGTVCFSANDTFAKKNAMENKTASGSALGFGSNGLQPIHLPLLEKCSDEFSDLKKRTIRNKVFCVGNKIQEQKNSTQSQLSICNGYSGGGFVFSQYNSYSDNSRYFIQGIVSHGKKDKSCSIKDPKVFTKVAPYTRWIDETVDEREGPKPGVWHQITVDYDYRLLVWDFTQDNKGVYKLQVVWGSERKPYEKGGKFYDDSLWMIKESDEAGFFTLVNKNLPNAVVTSYGKSLHGQFVVLIDEKRYASQHINDVDNEDHVLWKFEPRGDSSSSSFFNIYNKRFQQNGIMGIASFTRNDAWDVEIRSDGPVKELQKDGWEYKWKFMEAVPDGNRIPNTNLLTRVWYQINLTSIGLMVLSDDAKAEGNSSNIYNVKIISGDASADYKKEGEHYHKSLWMILKTEEQGLYTLVNKNISKGVVGTAKGNNRRFKFVVLIDDKAIEKDSSAKGNNDGTTQWQFETTPDGFYNIINAENNGYMTKSNQDNDDGSKYVETHADSKRNQEEWKSNTKYLWSFTKV